MKVLSLTPGNAHALFQVKSEVWSTLTKKVILLTVPNPGYLCLKGIYSNYPQIGALTQACHQWETILNGIETTARDLVALEQKMDRLSQRFAELHHEEKSTKGLSGLLHRFEGKISSLFSEKPPLERFKEHFSSFYTNDFEPLFKQAQKNISAFQKFIAVQVEADQYVLKNGVDLSAYFFIYRVSEKYDPQMWQLLEGAAGDASAAWGKINNQLGSIETHLEKVTREDSTFLQAINLNMSKNGWQTAASQANAFVNYIQPVYQLYQTDDWTYDISPKPPFIYSIQAIPNKDLYSHYKATKPESINGKMTFPFMAPSMLLNSSTDPRIGVSPGMVEQFNTFNRNPRISGFFKFIKNNYGYFTIQTAYNFFVCFDPQNKCFVSSRTPQLFRILEMRENEFLFVTDSGNELNMIWPSPLVNAKMQETYEYAGENAGIGPLGSIALDIQNGGIQYPMVWQLFWPPSVTSMQ